MAKNKKADQLVVAAPGPLTIGDKTYLVGPPSKADLLNIRKWVRKNHSRLLGAPTGLGFTSKDLEGFSLEDRRLFIAEAAKGIKKPKKELSEDEVFDLLTTPEGAAYMVWIAARRFDSSVTLKEFTDAITDENVEQVLADFDDATGVEDKEGEADPKAPGSDSSSPT